MSRPKSQIIKPKTFFSAVGPGLITGAADDDPAGIATYSVTGAKYGTVFLWTALITWPLMAFVQMMCARIGMVTGQGLSSAFSKKMPRWVVIIFCVALLAANILNVGADLSAMADALGLLTSPKYTRVYVLILGFTISIATWRLRYTQITSVLKWLTLSLGAYVITAFLTHPHWEQVAHDTFVPTLPTGPEQWSMLVAILGTTISPFLFYWQASQEVEEQKSAGLATLHSRKGATEQDLKFRMFDVAAGTFVSNIVMFFIILAAATALFAHGLHKIETAADAAQALQPFAGKLAGLLYSASLITTGLLTIPTLTASAAFALCETFKWNHGLDSTFREAKAFYLVILGSMVCAVIFNFAGLNPIKALYYSAVANGLLTPFVLVGVLLIAADRKIMNGQPSSRFALGVVGLATALMFASIAAMFI